MVRQAPALRVMLRVAKAEDLVNGPAGKKAKGKGKEVNGHSEEAAQSQTLIRLLLAGQLLASNVRGIANSRLGVLCNIVKPGSKADAEVDISELTNTTVLPIIHELLNVDLEAVIKQVLRLVTEAVSSCECPVHSPDSDMILTRPGKGTPRTEAWKRREDGLPVTSRCGTTPSREDVEYRCCRSRDLDQCVCRARRFRRRRCRSRP